MKMDIQDIVITGVGAVSSAGVGIMPLVEAVKAGKDCLTTVPEELGLCTGLKWGKADAFRASDFMPPLKARKFDRCSLLAVVTTGFALADAGIEKGSIPPERIGITMGSGFGGINNSEEFLSGYFTKGIEGLTPMLFPNTVANAAASNASIEHGLKGPNVTTVQRFCSAENAIHLACRFIEEGRADIMVAGGVDELTSCMMKGFSALHQLDSYASGYAEGCGLLALERRDHAVSRGARILGRINCIRTVGRLLKGCEKDLLNRLLPEELPERIVLSGTADLWKPLTDALANTHYTCISSITGRSIAMGGLSMACLLSDLDRGENALHLTASPEGPYYSVSFTGEQALNTDPTAYLPHRHPFLFLDRILSREPGISATAVHQLSGNEHGFPEILMVEALAQLAGVATVDEQDQGGFLAAIDHAEFMHPPKPGDTLILSVKIQKSFGRLFLLDGEVCADGRKLLVASLTLGVGKL